MASATCMFNDNNSAASLLATRRSGKPRDMIAPGPTDDQLGTMLAAAVRVPDHGKLSPWRFVIVGDDRRDRLGDLLVAAYQHRADASAAEVEGVRAFAHQAPTLIVALSSPQLPHKIPVWEQELSVGAAIMNLLIAAHAHGFVASWITGWAAYSDAVRDAFGSASERIGGFVFIGTASRPLEERPRPAFDAVVSHWRPDLTQQG